MTPYDTVLAGGTVVDGAGDAVPHVADVGISGGIIAAVGDLAADPRRMTLDVTGRVIAPGFIDTHTHIEMASLRGHPDASAAVAQGVTTTLVGADGFGWVGLGTTGGRWWSDMAAIYGPPPTPLPSWATPDEFMSDLRAKSHTDVVPLVPHGNVRAAVMGADPGPAGPDQIKAMLDLVDAWMDAGAAGMATGLDYLPGRYAGTDEIVTLCERVAEYGGVYASHMRLLDLGRAAAWQEIGEIGRRAGLPVRVAHERLDAEGADLLDSIAVDNDVTVDTYLYPAGCTSLAFHVPPEALAGGVEALSARLRSDAAFARRLAAHMEHKLNSHPGQEAIVAATTSGAHEGRTLSSLAAERGNSVGGVAVELLRDELPCALLVYLGQGIGAEWDEVVARTISDDRTIIASDGVYLGAAAHPRGFGAFPRVLGTLVREKGVVSMSTAIHKMSGKPAAAYGLADRGRIEVGRRADLVVFDPISVEGAGDFHTPRIAPVGIERVFVAGVQAPTGEEQA